MKILLVDDEPNIRDLMGRYLSTENIDSVGADNGFSAQRLLREQNFDACMIDLKMPGMDGLELIRWIRSEGFRMPLLMASAHGEITDAVEALKHGAQDYFVKPFNPEEVVFRIKSLVEAQNLKTIHEAENHDSDISFVGDSPAIVRIRNLISRIAPTSSTVLITGESGTGKEVVARSIHAQSNVASGPFIPINIGGVPENLLESELFGYEKGAFTGAVTRKIGLFEYAVGGTLFLDEIGDMPLALQVKILRVLQEKCITRLGGVEPVPINARIICATNKNIETAVSEGKFREDLFYRLNVVRIQIPPLRERTGDIPLLAHFYLQELNKSMNRHFRGFSTEAMDKLKRHPFYGNVRELENVLERAAIFSDGDFISADALEMGPPETNTNNEQNVISEVATLRDIERNAIERALRRWEGNRTRAAEELGISRRTLINKIQEYGLKEDL